MNTGIRYFITVLLAVCVTLSAFYLMHLLIDQRAGEVPQLDPVQVIRFEAVNIPEPPPRKPRTPPERPEPPNQPPPPSTIAVTPIEKIQTVVEIDPSPRNLVNSGPSRLLGTPHPTPGGEADRNARPSVPIAPPYPRTAAMAGIEGWVEVEVIIRADGSVRQARVLRANPARVFDDAALSAVRRWTWSPGMVGGRAIEQTVVQVIEFNLSGH